MSETAAQAQVKTNKGTKGKDGTAGKGASTIKLPRGRVLTDSQRKGLIFTRSGYLTADGKSLVSCVRVPSKSGSSFAFVTVPKNSVPVAKRTGETQPELPLPVIMCMLYKIGLGQKRCAPTFQHPFVGTYNKTFFAAGYALDFSDEYDDLLCLSAYGNYVQSRYWDDILGMVEPVYREARLVTATLALALLRAMRRDADGLVVGSSDDPATRKTKPARGDRVGGGFLPYAFLKDLGKVIRTDDDALAFVYGLQAIGCVKDFRPRAGAKSTPPKCVRYLREIGVPEDIPEDAKAFADVGNVTRVIECGHLPTIGDHVIPVGHSKVHQTMGKDAFDILTSETDEQPWDSVADPTQVRDAGDSDDDDPGTDMGIASLIRNQTSMGIEDETEIDIDLYRGDGDDE